MRTPHLLAASLVLSLAGHAAGATPSEEPPLSAKTAKLTLVCTPKCQSAIDNEKNLGPGHVFNMPILPGRHTLVLTRDAVTKTVVYDAKPGQLSEIRVAMDRP